MGQTEFRPVREQWAAIGQTPQNCSHRIAETQNGRLPRLAPRIADRPMGPIHVLGGERNQINLCCANVPEEFEEGVLLRIVLPRQELLMLLPGDASAVFEANTRPLARHQDRPRQPFHTHGKTVEPSQEDVGRNGAFSNHIQEVLRACFDECQFAKRIEGFLRNRTQVTILGGL